MTKAGDKDMDQVLRESGDSWRGTVQVDRLVSLPADVRLPQHRLAWRRMASAAVSVGVVGVVGLAAFRLLTSGGRPGLVGAPASPPPSQLLVVGEISPTPFPTQIVTATPSEAADRVVQKGDEVVARGQVLHREGEPTILCAILVQRGTDIGCVGPSVVLLGYTPSDVPGFDDSTDWFSGTIVLTGSWTVDGLSDASFVRVDSANGDPPRAVPCASPLGGWAADPESGVADSETNALIDEVNAHLDHYVEAWISDVPGQPHVMVVGTTGDVATARSQLQAIYPFNLCVVAVDYSSSELDAAASSVQADHPDWSVSADPISDRTVVRAVVLDEATAEAVRPLGDIVVVEALIEPGGN